MVGVEARVAQLGGVLGERDRPAALLGDAADLGGHELGVPDRHERQRHEATGVRAAPLVDVPVVVALEQTAAEVAVGGAAEQLTAEAGHRREAHRAEHAVDVHVADALVDVVRALADLVERGRLEAVLLGRTAGDRVEPDVGDLGALERPHVGVHLVFVDHPRCELEVGLRHVPLEEVGRLDDVVVDADEDEVVHVHDWAPPDRMVAREPTPAGRGTPPLVCSRACSTRARCRPRCGPKPRATTATAVTNSGDADQRDVVFGGQFLAQAIVAVVVAPSRQGRPLDPGVFARPGRIDAPTELAVEPMHDGRTFASDTVTAWQGDRLCARFMIAARRRRARRDPPRRAPCPESPARTTRPPTGPGGLVYPGSELRIVDDVDLWCTDAPVGPAESFLWTQAPVRSPTIPRCTARCSRGPPTGFLIGTALRPHDGHQPGRRAPRLVDRCGRAHDRLPRVVPRRRLVAPRARESRTRAAAGRSATPTCSPTTAASSRRTRRPT